MYFAHGYDLLQDFADSTKCATSGALDPLFEGAGPVCQEEISNLTLYSRWCVET